MLEWQIYIEIMQKVSYGIKLHDIGHVNKKHNWELPNYNKSF